MLIYTIVYLGNACSCLSRFYLCNPIFSLCGTENMHALYSSNPRQKINIIPRMKINSFDGTIEVRKSKR